MLPSHSLTQSLLCINLDHVPSNSLTLNIHVDCVSIRFIDTKHLFRPCFLQWHYTNWTFIWTMLPSHSLTLSLSHISCEQVYSTASDSRHYLDGGLVLVFCRPFWFPPLTQTSPPPGSCSNLSACFFSGRFWLHAAAVCVLWNEMSQWLFFSLSNSQNPHITTACAHTHTHQ